MKEKFIIGNAEYCALPELGIDQLAVRVDTGAKTSSLHVDNLQVVDNNNTPWAYFDIHPDTHQVERLVQCKVAIYDQRHVKSSNGQVETRYVIQTQLQLGKHRWPIEITLAQRSSMQFLMLLGRESMGDKVLVDPSQSYLLSGN